MFPVSQDFLNKIKDKNQEHRLIGTIGNQSFTEGNIVDGSFSIFLKSSNPGDVLLGSCQIGELNAEFSGINIGWSNWVGKVITPTFGLKLGDDSWEYIPLGVYKVAEANHTKNGVKVVAYDNMTKFDKKFKKSHFMNLSGMYNIISQICTDCGVTLGMTAQEIAALPNGSRTGMNIYGSKGKKTEFANDITTNRDALFWCAQTLGCFATMDRAGQLVFRKYHQNVVDMISDADRVEGATFEDYITHYIGIYVENLDDNTVDYYGYDTAALTAEMNETASEISADSDRIDELVTALAEWDYKLEHGECTQEEYDAAVAEIVEELHPLEIEVKQLTKRMAWLESALQQSGDDGSDMVLGANPLTMAANLTTRDAQRREILGALSDISYTPFSASVLCGAQYDLGDVIQFSGGLYNSDTDTFGCVMSWTYNHNGGTDLQGFGVDPSVVMIRNKTQKSTDRANKNAINSKEVFNGEGNPPENAKDGDVYVKTKKVRKNTHPLDTDEIHYNGYDIWREGYTHPIDNPDLCFNVKSVKWEEKGYHIEVEGMTFNTSSYFFMNANEGMALIKVPINTLGRYSFHAKIKLESTAPSRRERDVVGLAFIHDTSDLFNFVPYGQFVTPVWWGGELNLKEEQDEYYEYSGEFTCPSAIAESGYFYVGIMRTGLMTNSGQNTGIVKMSIKEFYIVSTSETYDDTHEDVVDEVYNYVVDDATGNGHWLKIDFGTLVGLQDTDISDPTDRQAIVFDEETEKWINEDLDFSKVVANPSGTATDDLNKVEIDGEIFNVAGGNVDDVKVDGTSVVTNKIANINTMTGAGASTAGAKGLVPAPASGDNEKFLRGDGTWQEAAGGNDVGLSVVNGAIDSTYDDDGTDVTADILKDSTGDEIVAVLDSIAEQIGLLNNPEVYAPIVYSDEEREVGVWRDGKPLYQKTIFLTFTKNTGVTSSLYAHNIANVDTIFVSSVTQGNVPRPSAGNQYATKITVTTTDINVETGVDRHTETAYITVQYTKTTDVAGSGSYAALGVPAVHYDDTERVIGTWFGSTLYQKTIDVNVNVNALNTWFYTSVTIANANQCIFAVSLDSSGQTHPTNGAFSANKEVAIAFGSIATSGTRTIKKVTLQYTKTS